MQGGVARWQRVRRKGAEEEGRARGVGWVWKVVWARFGRRIVWGRGGRGWWWCGGFGG